MSPIAIVCLLLGLLLCWPRIAHALDGSVHLSAYHHDSWTGQHGAPREIDAMAQTPDGWLWLGTMSGLYRFDGVRFEAFAPQAGESLLGKSITALAVRPNGELWIGYTFGGLSVLKDGRLRHLAPTPGDPVGATYAMAFERDGSAWIASTTGLLHYRDGQFTRADAGWNYPLARAEYVYRDHYDRLWAADGKALYLLDRAARRFDKVMTLEASPLLVAAPNGAIWLQDGGRMRPLPPPEGGHRPLPRPGFASSSFQSLFDRDGNFWAGNCPVGICKMRAQDWQADPAGFTAKDGGERLDQPWQLTSLNVHSMMEDREGNVWVGTVAGLERFRHNKLLRVPVVADAERLTLAADASGAVWAATQARVYSGQLWQIRDGAMHKVESDQNAYMVAPGKGGSVLVGGDRHIERRLGAQVVARYPLPPVQAGENPRNFVILVVEDEEGLWVGIGGRGLYRWHAGRWHRPAEHARLRGLLFGAVDVRGRSWFGLRNNRVLVRSGDAWREYGAADGINVGSVRFIDASGDDVLISGDHGMARLREGEGQGRFQPILAEQPDLLSNVSGMAVTPDGERWLNVSRGLLRVTRQDWERSMRDPGAPLRTTLWNDLDGYPGGAETVARVPSAFVAPDGKLWVAGTAGAAWFDPARLHRNDVAPAVEVLALQADGRRLAPGTVGVLAPGTSQLQVDYTALSYTMPERVRFRYRLLGLDEQWQEVGTRRVAYYTNLAPGSYRFEVAAVNEDGVAGQVAVTARFEIAPRFFQTWWFLLLALLVCTALLHQVYLWRLRQATHRLRARLEERLDERERIARTLHDTFLQSLQGLILRLHVVAQRLAPGSEVRAEVDRALDLADQVVAEGRERVMDLRAPDTPSLAEALGAAAEMLRTSGSAPVTVCAPGVPVHLPCALHDEVYHIAREAIANALRHAQAGRIEVEVRHERGAVTVAVRDDGIGLPADIQAHGRAGHWGLPGMRERARRIKAALAIRNRGQGGLEVVLTLPRKQLKARRSEPAAVSR